MSANTLTETDPRYPVGPFVLPATIAPDQRAYAVEQISNLPGELRGAVDDFDTDQLNTPYREGGWTVRQVVHHVADSHMQAYNRHRLALTEDWPTIRPYDEVAWSTLHDYTAPVEWSLELLESLHARWVLMLQSLSEAQWQRGFIHPQTGRFTVEQATLNYAWHGRHHTAHITHLTSRMGW